MQRKGGVGRAFDFAAPGTNIASVLREDYSSNYILVEKSCAMDLVTVS